MTKQEFDLLVKQLRQQGLNDDQIMKVFYEAFASNKCNIEDYELMVNWMGYELTDDFYKAHGLKRNR